MRNISYAAMLLLAALANRAVADPISSNTTFRVSANAVMGTGIMTAQGGTQATANMYAYSYQSTPTRIGPNQNTGTNVPNGAPALNVTVLESYFQVQNAPSIQNGEAAKVSKDYGPPILGVKGLAKPPQDSSYSLSSISGAYNGTANVVNSQSKPYMPGGGNGPGYTKYVQTSATYTPPQQGNATGGAAARATDPYPVASGTYAYTPEVFATVQSSSENTFAGTMFYAVDNTVYSNVANFDTDSSSPYANSLWTLSVIANGAVASTSQVNVSFYLNPLALEEIGLPDGYVESLPGYLSYVTGLPGYTPGMTLTDDQTAAFLDNAIASQLSGELTIDGTGTVTLNAGYLFPTGTTYTPALSNGTIYEDGTIAGISAVPAPAPFKEGVILIGCLLAVQWIRAREPTTS
jgi:hypothetical protein